MDNPIIPYLAGITLILGLAFGIYQYFRTRTAQRHHERSANAQVDHEPYSAPDAHVTTSATRANTP
jgi:hypothetical protein